MHWSLMPVRSRLVPIGMLIGGLSLLAPCLLASEPNFDQGRKLAMDPGKGNCIACHQFAGARVQSNVGPKLEDMSHRYPDRAALRAQIGDAGIRNPRTLMPPFGRYGILSEDEIDAITDFVYSL